MDIHSVCGIDKEYFCNDPTKKCIKCKSKAYACLPYGGCTYLCKKHFISYIEKRVLKIISKWKMISKGDRVAIGLSGGKDSTTLLHFMHRMKKRLGVELLAITVDYGAICTYGKKTMSIAREESKKLDIEHVVKRFKDEIGHTLDEIVEITKTDNPCSYCGVIRRRLLNKAALELGADKLAIAHSLDDVAETIMLNLARNEPSRLIRFFEPIVNSKDFVPRIRPFMELYEYEIVMYGSSIGLSLEKKNCCPFMKHAMRRFFRWKLNEIEDKYPGTKLKMLRSILEFYRVSAPNFKKCTAELNACKICGSPSASDVCKYCAMVDELKKKDAPL